MLINIPFKKFYFLFSFFCFMLSWAQAQEEYGKDAFEHLLRQNEKQKINSNILKIVDLQFLVDRDLIALDSLLIKNGFLSVMSDEENVYVWEFNKSLDETFGIEYPMLYFNTANYILTYKVDESNYSSLLGTLSQFRYEKDSNGVYFNGTYCITPNDQDYSFYIFNVEKSEERRKMYERQLQLYKDTFQSLFQEELTYLDSIDMWSMPYSIAHNKILTDIHKGDSLLQIDSFSCAKQYYAQANNIVQNVHNDIIPILYNKVINLLDIVYSNEKLLDSMYYPVTINDVLKDHNEYLNFKKYVDSVRKEVDELKSYGYSFTKIIDDKVRSADCEELFQKYCLVLSSKDEIEELYDKVGYATAKTQLQDQLDIHYEKRQQHYDDNKVIASFVGISEDQYLEMYDRSSAVQLQNKMNEIMDTIFLNAIETSPNIEKQNLSKDRKIVVKSRYSLFFIKNIVDIDNYLSDIALMPDILDVLFDKNKLLQKEYQENGSLFSSKESFFEAYCSDDYGQHIKNMKERMRIEEQNAKNQERAAEKYQKEREIIAHKQMKEEKKIERMKSLPKDKPVYVVLCGLSASAGVDVHDLEDYTGSVTLGVYFMFPTPKMISWGLYEESSLCDNFFIDFGLQFFLGRSSKVNFLFGGGLGYNMSTHYGALQYNVRLGLRCKRWTFFTSCIANPRGYYNWGARFNIGFHLGR